MFVLGYGTLTLASSEPRLPCAPQREVGLLPCLWGAAGTTSGCHREGSGKRACSRCYPVTVAAAPLGRQGCLVKASGATGLASLPVPSAAPPLCVPSTAPWRGFEPQSRADRDGQADLGRLGPRCVHHPSPPFLGTHMLSDPASTQVEEKEIHSAPSPEPEGNGRSKEGSWA